MAVGFFNVTLTVVNSEHGTASIAGCPAVLTPSPRQPDGPGGGRLSPTQEAALFAQFQLPGFNYQVLPHIVEAQWGAKAKDTQLCVTTPNQSMPSLAPDTSFSHASRKPVRDDVLHELQSKFTGSVHGHNGLENMKTVLKRLSLLAAGIPPCCLRWDTSAVLKKQAVRE